MSIEYCHYCDKHIDLDFNSDHFEYMGDGVWKCVEQLKDEEDEEDE